MMKRGTVCLLAFLFSVLLIGSAMAEAVLPLVTPAPEAQAEESVISVNTEEEEAEETAEGPEEETEEEEPEEETGEGAEEGTETPEETPEETPTPAPKPQAKLQISEVCADNDFVWTLDFQDYIEIYNAGKTAVRLSDYRLQVKQKTAQLPDVTLKAGGYYVLLCDGKTLPKVSKSGCGISILDEDGSIVDTVTVPASKNQVWYRSGGLSYTPSPGYANNSKGRAAWYNKVRGDLIISEALCGNFSAFAFGKERYCDALEVYNAGKKNVRLSDYYLSDDRKTPAKYRFPNVTLKPGECYVVYCTKEKSSGRHTGFKLSSDGEMVYLSKGGKNKMVDVLNIPPLPLDVSYGRKNGACGYFSSVSLGKENTATCYLAMAEKPALSVASGGYKKAFTVKITGEGPFYYTTDGSAPNKKSEKYTKPISIKSTTTLRVAAFPKGKLHSEIVTAEYRFDTGKYTLPTVTISLPRNYLTNNQYGLLKKPEDKDLEVPATVTFLEANGKMLFSLDCGLSIAGQTSRVQTNRGWKVSFRGKYGAKTVGTPVFPGWDVDSMDSFVFRLGTTGNPIHDVLGAAIGADVMEDVLYQRYRPVNLFIGGTYYGIYYMREHVNANFIVNHLGGDADHVDMVYCVSETKLGSNKNWLSIVNYCKTHNLSNQEYYDYVAARINIQSFIDYYIWRPYTGDSDSPNIRYVRSRNGKDKRWHLVMYDMDWAFQKKNQDVGMNRYTYKLYEEEKHNNVVIYALFKNSGFRRQFLERLSYHMQNTFAPSRVNGILDKLNKELQHDLPESQKRWNSSMNAWNKTIREIKSFIGGKKTDRRTLLLKETKKFFSLTDAKMKEYFCDIKYK